MNAEPLVLITARGAVTQVTLNRPPALNPMDRALAAELADAMERLAADDSVRCIVVTGAGRAFSAGGDLRAMQDDTTLDFVAALREGMNRVISAMRSMPKPVICSVNGVAAGAGVGLALAGDVVLAARSASFCQAFARVGLVPDAGNTWLLPRAVGDSRARAMMITTDTIAAEQALAMGMVWKLCDDADLAAQTDALADRLAYMPTRSFALIKQALLSSQNNALSQQLELEAALQHQAGQTEDFQEGMAAFLNKRKPAFTGR
jgi:2-(1,2-epoxy-1,2-dihydrophenyl)acetyl-CoA isomerase